MRVTQLVKNDAIISTPILGLFCKFSKLLIRWAPILVGSKELRQ